MSITPATTPAPELPNVPPAPNWVVVDAFGSSGPSELRRHRFLSVVVVSAPATRRLTVAGNARAGATQTNHVNFSGGDAFLINLGNRVTLLILATRPPTLELFGCRERRRTGH